jgi:hypothetical protein
MPLVEADTFNTLRSAAIDPKTYASGSERQSLRAAFDIASSQITKQIFDFEAETRPMRRSRLNAQKDIPEQYKEMIAALKKALKTADALDKSGGYDEDDEDATKFIRNALAPLVKAIEPFQ